jgi:hypothetical protein
VRSGVGRAPIRRVQPGFRHCHPYSRAHLREAEARRHEREANEAATAALPDEFEELAAEERESLLDDFLSSPEGERWRNDADAEDVAAIAIEFGADYNYGGPLRWSPAVDEIFTTGWLARKVPREVEFFERVPEVLRDSARFSREGAGSRSRPNAGFAVGGLDLEESNQAAVGATGGAVWRWTSGTGPTAPRSRAIVEDEASLAEEVDDVEHWLSSPKREEIFGPMGITARTFRDPEDSKRVGLIVEIPDIDMVAFQEFMQTDAAADAMKHDGVHPATLLILSDG